MTSYTLEAILRSGITVTSPPISDRVDAESDLQNFHDAMRDHAMVEGVRWFAAPVGEVQAVRIVELDWSVV